MDLSIIIPAYNRLWSLPETIESCRGGHCLKEIIVVDDGSNDGTYEWLNKQNDIITLRQSHLGKCWAVNKAFQIAKGKYIRFLDADDLLFPSANDEQLSLGSLTSADIVVSGYQTFNNLKQTLKKQMWIETNDFIAQQLGECDSSHYSAYLFKRTFIENIPHRPDFAFRDDRLFVLEAALKYPKVAIHKGTALLHRIHYADRLQVSSGLKQEVQNFQHLHIYKNILQQLELEGRLTKRHIDAVLKILWPLAHWIAKNHLDEAEEVVKWIYNLDPGFSIPDRGLLGMLYRHLGFKNAERILKLRRQLIEIWK
ncbi:glycosyltransferase involved in cell wall biosynthesis [Pedobacter sp. AK017]|uniref:glycosyltransferase family 2 protein n=1 Tax=Pedobacter sp. AK017 TaxID=2723073 RepID=UPI00161AC28C|nr:glycosyltransferase family 2 protein [Pedobacter sp. AK017]MBB5438876.1 glycosyltransferase involved in cell wall biosynthesis [Pedobacter sp. AK017]